MSQQRLPSTSGVRHTLITLAAIGYGTFLAFVVFWPSPVDKPIAAQLDRVIQELHERGVPGFVDYGFIEFTANIALFIPVGFILGLAIPVRWWMLALILGPTLSAAIEMIQHALLDARYSAISDVIANSVGATIGLFIAVLLRATVHARDQRVIARHEALARARPLQT